LPVLEEELANLTDKYDVLALAHSEYGPTLDWVNENLNGELKIGFSTSELRDYFRVVGQPITLILDTNGEVIYREFGAIDFSSF
jgi:thioredoxin-related protein